MIGAGTEAEHQEEPPQEEEYVDEEQDQDQELTDFYNTQGKHRCMINSVPFTVESYNFYYTYAFKFIGFVWYLVA